MATHCTRYWWNRLQMGPLFPSAQPPLQSSPPPSIIAPLTAVSISYLLLLSPCQLQPQWPPTENPMTPPQKDISSHHFPAKLLQRFSPAVWRKQHSLLTDCGHLRIWPCSSLFLSPPCLLTVPDLHTSLLQIPSLYPRCVAVGFFLSFRP